MTERDLQIKDRDKNTTRDPPLPAVRLLFSEFNVPGAIDQWFPTWGTCPTGET